MGGGAGNMGASAYLEEVRDAVRSRLNLAGNDRFAPAGTRAKLLVQLAVVTALYAALVAGAGDSVSAYPLLWCALGFAAGVLWLNFGHDATHRTLSRRASVNEAVQALAYGLIGLDPWLHGSYHRRIHHVCALEPDRDLLAFDLLPARWSGTQPWRAWHRLQHVYAPLSYPLGLVHVNFWYDPRRLAAQRVAAFGVVARSHSLIGRFLAFKAVHLALLIGAPMALGGVLWWQALLGYFAMSACASAWITTFTFGAHFFEGMDAHLEPKPEMSGAQRLVRQMTISLDVSPRSRLLVFLAGGMPAHAAHHLFPHVSHGHYRAITAVIAAAAARHGVCYNRTSFPGMVRLHLRFLKRMGRPPGAALPVCA